MNLYRTFDSGQSTRKVVWTTSSGAASKAATAMKAELKTSDLPHKDVKFEAVEVDTRKDGLVAFLNELTG